MQLVQATSELGQRIDALRARLGRTAEEMNQDDALHYPVAGFSDRAEALRQRLPESDGSAWALLVREFERDLLALERDVNHWMAYIDRHYSDQRKAEG